MKLDEFQQIITAHRGLRDEPAVLDPEVETTDRFGRASKGPNPTPTRRYIFNDGTSLEAIYQQNGDVQVTNPGTALNTAGVQALAGPGGQKPIEVGGKLVQPQADGTYKTVWPTDEANPGEKPIEIGGKIVQRNPATGKYDILWEPPTKRTPPTVALGAPRAGQKTDLRAVELAYNVFAQQLASDPNITDEEYNRRLQAYIAQNVTPAVEAAAREVTEEAERKQREEAAATARAAAREERLDTAADRSEARSYAEFAQRAGQNAVSNALALLPYQTNPKFLEQYTAGLNVLARGGGAVTFTPDAFQIPLPDLNALAQQGADRAAAMYRAAGGVPLAPRPEAAVAPAGPALNAPVARTSFPGAPGEPLYPPSPAAALEAIPLARRPPQV